MSGAATSARIPPEVLAEIDEKAKALGLSRNTMLVRVLRAGLAAEEEWPESFREALLGRAISGDTRRSFGRSMDEVRRRRKNKAAPKL